MESVVLLGEKKEKKKFKSMFHALQPRALVDINELIPFEHHRSYKPTINFRIYRRNIDCFRNMNMPLFVDLNVSLTCSSKYG